MASLFEYPWLIKELYFRHTSTKIIEACLLVLLMLLSLFGNALICYVITVNQRLRTPSNMLVLNLAVSDILMAVICMPLSLGVLVTGRWPYGVTLCDIQGFFIFSFGIVSEATMCAIAINRFFAISKPFLFTSYFAPQQIRIIIVFLWLLPVLATVPPLAGWGYYAFQPGKAFCIYPFNVNIIYTVLVEVLFIFLPSNVIVICYKKCYTAMKLNNRRIADMTQGGGAQAGAHRRAQESRATRTMMSATAGYMICWIPVAIIDFVDVGTGGGNLPRQVYMLNAFLIYLSSTINPFIYWIMNKDFKRAFHNVLPCLATKLDTSHSSDETRSRVNRGMTANQDQSTTHTTQ